jgi:hypothetical protein
MYFQMPDPSRIEVHVCRAWAVTLQFITIDLD